MSLMRLLTIACVAAFAWPACTPADGDAGDDAGEGEGEGEGACDLGGFGAGAGGLTARDAALAPDPQNLAGCGLCFLTLAVCVSDEDCGEDRGADPCIGGGQASFVLTVVVDGLGPDEEELERDAVRWSEAGGAPQLCTEAPLVEDGVVVCPLCLDVPPADMAVQVGAGAATSDAVCVDTTGVEG